MTKSQADKIEPMPDLPDFVQPSPGAAFASAPIVFFDFVTAHGQFGGICELTLEATRLRSEGAGVVIRERVVVAHLRGSQCALLSLKQSIDGALEMLAPKVAETAH